MVYNLLLDIMLVKVSSLLNEPQVDIFILLKNVVFDVLCNLFCGVKLCKLKKLIEFVYVNCFFEVLSESIS